MSQTHYYGARWAEDFDGDTYRGSIITTSREYRDEIAQKQAAEYRSKNDLQQAYVEIFETRIAEASLPIERKAVIYAKKEGDRCHRCYRSWKNCFCGKTSQTG